MPKEPQFQTFSKELTEAVMNSKLTEEFDRVYNHTRGRGNTDAVATAAAQFSGVVLVPDEAFVQSCREHWPDAKFVSLLGRFQGSGVILVDMKTVIEIVHEAQRVHAKAQQLLDYGRMKGVWR